ncbi:MAG: hypothetical protein AAF804_13410 [Bacteroidota bacterium]
MKILVIGVLLFLIILSFLKSSPQKREQKPVDVVNQGTKRRDQHAPQAKGSSHFTENLPSTKPSFQATDFIGEVVHGVYYALVNYGKKFPTYEAFHLCDQAVLIHFGQDKWLNWVWEEGENMNTRFRIRTGDQQALLKDTITQIVPAHQEEAWKGKMGQTVTKLSLVHTTLLNGESALSDLIIEFQDGTVRICGIPEPEPADLPSLPNLSFANAWTLVAFDQHIFEGKRP